MVDPIFHPKAVIRYSVVNERDNGNKYYRNQSSQINSMGSLSHSLPFIYCFTDYYDFEVKIKKNR
jgi:hypothetical protein